MVVAPDRGRVAGQRHLEDVVVAARVLRDGVAESRQRCAEDCRGVSEY